MDKEDFKMLGILIGSNLIAIGLAGLIYYLFF